MAQYSFISNKTRPPFPLAFIAFLLAFVVILLGATTRLTDAGLSCPDWPHCYGYLTAPHTTQQQLIAAERFPLTTVNVKKAWTEMIHRYAAGIEGLLIITIAFSSLFSKKPTMKAQKTISLLLLGLLGSQVLLGMLTVTEKLKPIIVLGHLLNGLSLLCLLWWMTLSRRPAPLMPRKPSVSPATKAAGWLGLLLASCQITLGGWLSTHYAGLACIDFPYCNGKLLPPLHLDQLNTDLITIHMLHRLGALISACYLTVLAWYLSKYTYLRSLATLMLALVFLQLTLGILNIVWLRPVWIALLHHGVAILLLLTLITLLHRKLI